jgi:hypothetical protein
MAEKNSATTTSGAPAYTGPAPAPSRRLTLEPKEPFVYDPDGPAQPSAIGGPNEALANGFTYKQPTSETFESTPPVDPDLAAKVAQLEQANGRMIQALGAQKAEQEQKMEEQRLLYEAQLASMTTGSRSAPQGPIAPEGADPNRDGPTWSQLQNVLAQERAESQAVAIQSTWDVTTQEITEIFNENPVLGQLPEPRRTMLVHQFAHNRRKSARVANLQQASAPAGSPEFHQGNVRPLNPAHIAPNVGGTSGPPEFPEPRVTDQRAAAAAEYEAANKIKDVKERNKARKKAMEKAMVASGLSHNELSHSAFVSSRNSSD